MHHQITGLDFVEQQMQLFAEVLDAACLFTWVGSDDLFKDHLIIKMIGKVFAHTELTRDHTAVDRALVVVSNLGRSDQPDPT